MALVVFGACFLAYVPLFRAGFIWDDDGHVTRADLQSLAGLHRIWFSLDSTQQYYPALHSAFWVEHRLWGDSALGYHLLNIGLHAAAACLLALFLTRLLRLGQPQAREASPAVKLGAWAAALLFALHPLSVESVAWVSEQKNTLSTCLALLAGCVFLRFWQGRSWLAYGGATLLFILAVLSKSVTVTTPAALLVLLWWRIGRLAWRRDVLPLLPWLAFGLGFGLMTAYVERTYVGAAGASFALGPLDRLVLAARVVFFYAGKWLWPHPLIFIYPRWQVNAGIAAQWWGVIGVLAALLVAWKRLPHSRGPLALVLCYSGLLFPALGFFNVYPFVFSYVADHFQYFASLVLAAAVGLSFGHGLSKDGAARFASLGLLVLLAGGWAILTRVQARQYQTEAGLYEATLARNPDAWLAHGNLGAILAHAGKVQQAIGHYQTALALYPDSPQTFNNLGNAYATLHDYRNAEAAFAEAVRLRPQLVEAHVNWGVVAAEQARFREARQHYLAALAIQPNNAEAEYRLGCADANADRLNEAIGEFEAALVMRPDFPEALANLGLALTLRNQSQEAIPLLERAVALAPHYAEGHAYFGLALAKAGRLPEAVDQYRVSLAINPRDADVHYQLAVALGKLGRSGEAKEEFDAASRTASP